MKKYGIAIGLVMLGIIIGILLIRQLEFMMNVNKPMNIAINGKVPLNASVDSTIGIKLLSDLKTRISIEDALSIDMNEVIDVPLKMTLTVPLNTDVFMDQVLDLKFDLPVDINLDQSEIGLNNLVIPFNKKLRIHDSLAVDFSIPLDTKIRTNFKHFMNISLPVKADIPVKVNIPIDQPLQVNDTLILNAQDYHIPLKTIIPVAAQVPIKQKVHISGELTVPVDQMVSIPLKKVIHAPVTKPFTANVKTLNDNIQTSFNSNLSATATFTQPLRVDKMDSLRIDPSDIKISFKK